MMINSPQDTSWFIKPVWQQINDSLQAVAVQHVPTSTGSNELGEIVSGLDEISKFGIGFGDVLSLIAIPLIIALFAFAFPFLFSVITHIHNKYESERISQMLSGSVAYKWFLWTSGGSAAFLVVIAIIAIALVELTWYSTMIKIIECISIAVAAGYSYVIVWFVYTCIKFNQPETLIELVHERYGIEKKELDKYLKRLDKKEKQLEKLSEGERYVWKTGLRLGRSWSKEGIEELRSERLVALACHALKTRNSQLFQKILTYVSTISNEVKKEVVVGASYSVSKFYLGCMDAYLQIPEDARVEESLLMYWFQSISRCRIPWERGIADMLSKIVHAAKIGREGLMERYFQDAAWRFDFLHLLPAVSFVSGDNEALQQEMTHDERCTMDDICKMHYFVAAYLFAEGNYKAIKYALPRRGGVRKLLPYFANEILRTYAKCKKELGGSSDYQEWYVNVIVGRKVEANILERYTVFRLMTAAEMYSPYHIMMGEPE